MPSLKHFLPGASALLVVTGYLAWTYNHRGQVSTLELERKAKEAAVAKFYKDNYGTEELKITQFLARSYEIARGEKALLCYGVLNATAVRLDPPAEPLHPSPTFCFNVSPVKTMLYTLIAEDKNGKTTEQSLTLTVK